MWDVICDVKLLKVKSKAKISLKLIWDEKLLNIGFGENNLVTSLQRER